MMPNQHTILSKLISAKSDDTLLTHYCFRNNEMQSEFRDRNLTHNGVETGHGEEWKLSIAIAD